MRIVLNWELTDLNTYINAERRNRFLGAKIKKEETEKVAWSVKGLKKIKVPVFIDFSWYTKNERKDPDNVAFTKKFVLDGLVTSGILINDTRKEILGFTDSFFVDKQNPRVVVNFRTK